MIKNIGVLGMGSIGSSLVWTMSKDDSKNVYIAATGERAKHLKKNGISVNGNIIFPKVYCGEGKETLDLLIVTVKTYSLKSAMDDMQKLVTPDTIILPVQNGIKATKVIKERFPDNQVLYGVILRTDAHRMGRSVFFNTLGEMQIGNALNNPVAPEVQEIHDKLRALGINVKIYEDMMRVQWRKWMLNIGASQVAAEAQVECGFFGQVEEIRDMMRLCIDEVISVASAEGVNVGEKDRDEIIDILVNFPPDKKMSMLQDIEAGRPLEIDEYAGTVIELGKKHGIVTPVNEVFYLAITAREKISKMRKHIDMYDI